jgi:NADPH-dependent curcumin reductase CurA
VAASDFRLETTEVPAARAGQLLLRTLYLSLDPYMRGRMNDRKSYAKPVALGDVMTGESVAEVIASDLPEYARRTPLAPAWSAGGWDRRVRHCSHTCRSRLRAQVD